MTMMFRRREDSLKEVLEINMCHRLQYPVSQLRLRHLRHVRSTATPFNETLLLQVPMYSVCSRIDLVFSMLPANVFASSSFASKLSHMDFDLLVRTMGVIWRLLSIYSMVFLLTSMGHHVFRPFLSTNSILVVMVSRAWLMVSNLFPFL